MKSSSSRIFDGFTVEGFHFQLQAFYRHDSDTPYRLIGVYGASDGAGEFDVEEERDLPWVVSAGDWYRVR